MILELQREDSGFTGAPPTGWLLTHLPLSLSQATCADAPLHSLAGTANLEGRTARLCPARKVALVSPPLKSLPVTALTLTQVTGKPREAACSDLLPWSLREWSWLSDL